MDFLVTSCSLCSMQRDGKKKSSGLSKEALIYSDAHPRETHLQHQKYSHIKRLKTHAFIYFKFDLTPSAKGQKFCLNNNIKIVSGQAFFFFTCLVDLSLVQKNCYSM